MEKTTGTSIPDRGMSLNFQTVEGVAGQRLALL